MGVSRLVYLIDPINYGLKSMRHPHRSYQLWVIEFFPILIDPINYGRLRELKPHRSYQLWVW